MKNNNKGFSLVELIVVIAIMAILAAVAIPTFATFITKANQASDEQLLSDIKYGLELYYYSNPDEANDGVLVLNLNGDAQTNSQFIIDAMTATYGEDWRSELALKHDGWNSTFQDSSFSGNQQGMTALLGTVETLTDALGSFLSNEGIASALGDGFNDYMTEMGATTAQQKADAAVFYVADKTAGLSSTSLQNAANAIVANQNQEPIVVMGAMNQELGSTMASAATMYALAEGYATFFDNGNYDIKTGEKTPRTILTEATANIKTESGSYADTAAAFAALLAAFKDMGNVNPDAMAAYMAQNSNGVSPMSQDMVAFSDAMKTVSASKDDILANNTSNGVELGSNNYFTSDYIQGIVSSYTEGGIFVYVKVEDSGLKITTSIDAEQ